MKTKRFSLFDLLLQKITFASESMTAIFLTVRVSIPDGVDGFELAENCDYQFSYDYQSLDTEIIEVFDASGQQLF